MFFSKQKIIYYLPDIYYEDSLLKSVNKVKFLGVIIDNKQIKFANWKNFKVNYQEVMELYCIYSVCHNFFVQELKYAHF